jgi:hypothetical protein
MDFTLLRTFLLAFFILLSVGCASRSPLSGKWSLITDGISNQVIIEQLDTNTFYIKSQELEEVSGKYKLEKRHLKLVTPEHPRINELVFEITEDDSWVIINAPPSSRMPVRLIGAKLVR